MTASGQHESGRPGSGVPTNDVPDQEHDVAAVLQAPSFRRFRPVLAGSSFAGWLGLLALIAAAANLAGESYTEINLAVAAVLVIRLAPVVLTGPVISALADRMGGKLVLLSADLLRGLLFVSIPLLGSLTWLYVAAFLVEVLTLFSGRAKESAVAALVPHSQAGSARQATRTTIYSAAPVAALAFAGISLLNGILGVFVQALDTRPVDLALYATAVAFVCSSVLIARAQIPRRAAGQAPARESVIGSISSGRRFVASTPAVRSLATGMLAAFAAAGLVVGLAQTYVRDLGAGQPGFGVLFAAVLLGIGLGLRVSPGLVEGFSRFRLFGLSLIVAGAFLAAIALIPNMVMATLLTVGLGACAGIGWSTGNTLLGQSLQARGRTEEFLTSATRVALLVVLAAGPLLAAAIGPHTINFTDSRSLSYNGAAFVFLVAAVLTVALGVATYRQLDDRPGTGLLQDLRTSWAAAHRAGHTSRPRVEYPGVFVALEGGDGSGKSTQARLLADWLRSDQGHDVVLTREPGATPLGVRLREVLLGSAAQLGSRPEALLFAADRAHHVEAVVRPALARGAVVVTDRYIDSSVAYQGAGRELDGEEVRRISDWATDGLLPALTVLLDVDPTVSKARRAHDITRGGEDRLEAEPEGFHERVRAEFLSLAGRDPHRYLVIDAGLSAQEVQQLIREGVRQVLPVSARRRAELEDRLSEEEQTRERRARAEAEVMQMDADLRRRRVTEAREREEARRRARDEAERQLQQEAERELRAQESQRNREEVDRRASEAAAAAALGPVTEPVQMPRRPLAPQPVQPPQQPDAWGPPQPADPTVPVQNFRPQQEGDTNPVPQRPLRPQQSERPHQSERTEQELRPVAPPRTVQLPEIDVTALERQDVTINLAEQEATETTGENPVRRRGRRQA